MQDRSVFLISDRREKADRLARGIALIMPCRVIEPGSALPAERPSAYVVDLPAERVEGTAWIEALARRIAADDAPCLYLARGMTGSEAAAARRFGDPIVVPAKNQANGVVATLLRAIGDGRGRRRGGPVAIETRVREATHAVTDLFDAAASGRPPSRGDADAGTQIVLEAVSEVGIRGWLDLIWRHDISVYQHSLSVAGFAAAFAAELGFSRGDRYRLARAALLHDVGKARIPAAILDKPGPLTPDETAVMRSHTTLGADLLGCTGAFDDAILEVVRSHHERLDGSGYPDGLTGSAIGDLARLVAICDVHSALTERRVYRAPMSARRAAAIMDGMAGQLDPDLLRIYRRIILSAAPADAFA